MTGPAIVDYSFARPAPTTIKQAGYQGAARYLSWQPNPKNVTPAEAEAIWAAGLDLGLVWESTAQAASGGRNAGQKEGAEALRQAVTLGWPEDRPVYFVMEDPNRIPLSAWPAVEDYCRGLVDAGWSPARIGGYGSQALIEHLHAAGLITWGWQVGGWSPTVSAVCHLYQRLAPTLAPPALAASVDEDAVLKADWGGWHPGQPGQPGQQPAASTPTPALQEDEMVPKVVTATDPATGKAGEYVIRNDDVIHIPDGTCANWAWGEFANGATQMAAVPWEVILWWNNGHTPA